MASRKSVANNSDDVSSRSASMQLSLGDGGHGDEAFWLPGLPLMHAEFGRLGSLGWLGLDPRRVPSVGGEALLRVVLVLVLS